MQPGTLYIVSTPIGNYRDITLRALDTLRAADAIICEEYRQGSTLLKKLDIQEKELLQLNEHNEEEQAAEIIQILFKGKDLALISDCGTPAFADPGTYLIKLALEYQIKVIPIPGVSSLMTAISVSPLPMDQFYFAGFLPRKTEVRQNKLRELAKMRVPIILMDTPYRLEKMLQEIKSVFGNKKMVTLTLDLTLDSEKIIHGYISEVISAVGKRKSEFLLILH